MILSIEIPIKEQKKILSYLVDIPPLDYLNDCDTEDRIEHWINCKFFYLCLHNFLKNHFTGTPLPTEIYIEDLKITVSLSDKVFLQQIGSYLDYYLKLYNVLSWGWKYIDSSLKQLKLENPALPIPETPGEALITIIDQYFHGLFYVYFPEKVTGNYYDEYSPRKAYNTKMEDRKTSQFKKQDFSKLTATEKKKIAAHESKMKKEQKLLEPFVGLEKFYISICLPNQKGDETLKRRLSDLKESASQIEASITRSQHPRNKRQGYALSKGVVIPATNKGGIYRSP